MSEIKHELPREYFERWQRVGPELEKIRRRELRAYRFAENRELVNELLEMAAQHAKPRRTTGMLKLQRLLREHAS